MLTFSPAFEIRQYLPYMVPFLVTAAIALAFSVYALQRRKLPGAYAFLVLTVAVAIWSLAYGLEIGFPDVSAKIFWGKIQYLGIVLVPPAWVIFILYFSNNNIWLTQRNLVVLGIIPIITVLLVFTTEQHGLMWRQISLDPTGPFPALDIQYGSWFWVHWAYANLLVLIGVVLLIKLLFQSVHIYRWQAVLLLLAAFLPWLANSIYVFGRGPLSNLDLTPVGFAVACAILGLNMLRFRLLDVKPLAQRTLVDLMYDAVIVLDADNKVVDLNPAAERITRQRASEAVGLTQTGLLGQWPELINHCRGVPDNKSIEVTLIERNGQKRYFDVRVSALFNSYNQLSGRIIVMRDITDRKHNEVELAHARDKALEASHFKSELLARISHELRTPLASILGYAELLDAGAYGAPTKEQSEALGKVVESTNYLSRLVNELLDQAQFDAGKIQLDLQPFVVAELIRKAEAKMNVVAVAKGVTLTTSVEPNVPNTLIGDENRLQQIIVNLIGNAIKFSPHGRVHVEILYPNDNNWIIKVSDNGMGIPSEAQVHIFEPFRQADGSMTRKYGGAGLGLSIVKKLVTLMDGRISLESVEGKGSTFTVILPVIPYPLDVSPAV